MVKGQIVCSKAGSDRNGFSVITEVGEKVVYICDGKRYKLQKPKRKNIKHIAPTKEILSTENISTDKALRKALAEYRSKM